MKMTMHINSDLLAKAMRLADCTSKTAMVDLALREFVRRAELLKTLSSGLDRTPEQLRNILDPAYDLEAMRMAETPIPYGRKSRARR